MPLDATPVSLVEVTAADGVRLHGALQSPSESARPLADSASGLPGFAARHGQQLLRGLDAWPAWRPNCWPAARPCSGQHPRARPGLHRAIGGGAIAARGGVRAGRRVAARPGGLDRVTSRAGLSANRLAGAQPGRGQGDLHVGRRAPRRRWRDWWPSRRRDCRTPTFWPAAGPRNFCRRLPAAEAAVSAGRGDELMCVTFPLPYYVTRRRLRRPLRAGEERYNVSDAAWVAWRAPRW